MLKPSDLTVSERGKLAPGLQTALQKAMAYKGKPLIPQYVRELDWRGRLDIDLWIEKVDGTRWFLRERNIPKSWTIDHWVDFVIKLAKQKYVTQVGIMREYPLVGAPILPGGHPQEVYSPQELITVAARAPEPTITIDEQENQYTGGGGGTGGGNTTGGGATGGGTNYGAASGVAALFDNPMMWFGILAGGALLMLLLRGKKEPTYEPELYEFDEED